MKRSHFGLRLIVPLVGALILVAFHYAVAANPDHVAQFQKTHACTACDLTHAKLAGIQAPHAKLANANLAGADLYGASLRDADLTGAVLDGANLEMVDLTGATGAVLGAARTDSRTTCPDGTAGPCR